VARAHAEPKSVLLGSFSRDGNAQRTGSGPPRRKRSGEKCAAARLRRAAGAGAPRRPRCSAAAAPRAPPALAPWPSPAWPRVLQQRTNTPPPAPPPPPRRPGRKGGTTAARSAPAQRGARAGERLVHHHASVSVCARARCAHVRDRCAPPLRAVGAAGGHACTRAAPLLCRWHPSSAAHVRRLWLFTCRSPQEGAPPLAAALAAARQRRRWSATARRVVALRASPRVVAAAEDAHPFQ
jgi:hypothetical protein